MEVVPRTPRDREVASAPPFPIGIPPSMADSIQITLPDGSTKAAPAGIRVGDFVKESHRRRPGQGRRLRQASTATRSTSPGRSTEDGKLEVLTTKTPEALEIIRHDAAHVVASVVQRLFPGTQVTIGPTIEDGFYYDFFRDKPFTPEDLEAIEDEANEEIAQGPPVRPQGGLARTRRSRSSSGKGEKFKVEIIEDIVAKGAKTLTLYSHGDWVDFCLGPHGPSTGRIGVIKLLSLSGAYWRGDHRNPMLQRIYGTAFFDKKELDAWLKQQEEAKKRDHRKLGKELDLFDFHPSRPAPRSGRPKGTVLYHVLADLRCAGWPARTATRRSRPRCSTTRALWETSGHWGKYKENMFLVLDSETERARLLAQADELPVAPPVLRLQEAQLPRPAAAPAHPGRAAPQRGVGRARRADPRAPVRAGRRAHLLHGGADRRRGEALRPAARPASTTRSASSTSAKFATRPAQRHRRRRAVGPGRGRARRRRSKTLGLAVRAQARATAPSTARRSTSTCPTASAASGSSAPSSSTTTRPSASTSPTSARTTPSTARSSSTARSTAASSASSPS